MALIKLGGLAQDVRGSLNGTTFSRNRGGAYVRTKVSPINPSTTWQVGQRSNFRTIAQAWASTLTPEQRLAWISYAQTHQYTNVFGDAITLSGIAYFQAINRVYLFVTTEIMKDPPDDTEPAPDMGGIAPTASVATPTFLLHTINTAGTSQAPIIFCTPPLGAGVAPKKTDYRMIESNGQYVSAISSYATDQYDEYCGRFGIEAMTAGKRIGVIARGIDQITARQGAPYSAIITVAT